MKKNFLRVVLYCLILQLVIVISPSDTFAKTKKTTATRVVVKVPSGYRIKVGKYKYKNRKKKTVTKVLKRKEGKKMVIWYKKKGPWKKKTVAALIRIKVIVNAKTVNNYNKTFTVNVKPKSNAITVLKKTGLTVKADSYGYVSKIGKLAAGSHGAWSGWIYDYKKDGAKKYVWGSKSMKKFKVKKSMHILRLRFSKDGGMDLGMTW